MLAFRPFEGSLDDWEKVLVKFPDAEVFQTSDWIRFIAESHGAKPVIALLYDGSEEVGYFAGLCVHRFGIKILAPRRSSVGQRISWAVPAPWDAAARVVGSPATICLRRSPLPAPSSLQIANSWPPISTG